MKKSIVFSVCAAAVLLFFASFGFATAAITRPKPEGRQAPAFSLATIGGSTVTLSGLKDKKVVLFFFTTWCPYCREKFGPLAAEKAALEKEGAVLLPINVGESAAKIDSFREKNAISFDILMDMDGAVAKKYGVVGVPTFILIGAKGSVLYDGNDLPWNYAEIFRKE